MTFDDAKRDPELLALLKKFMTSKLCLENYAFLMSKDSNDKLYKTFVPDSAAQQINIKAPIKAKLDELAGKKKWSDMTSSFNDARKEILGLVNSDTMPKFLASNEYKAYMFAKAPKAPDLTAATAAAKVIDANMNEGAKFLTAAAANVKSKGLPADKEEVGRMFESGRMRHDKVHEAFTALLQKDKAFTRANFGPFFTKKDAYSKMWAEYRKLLGK